MQKLNRSILHGSAEQGRRRKIRKSWSSLFDFRCDFILLAVAERDGGCQFKTKTDVTGARYVRTTWPCVLIIMIIKWLLSSI